MVAVPRLQLKLIRDLNASRVQFGAVVLVIILGILMFIGPYSAYQNLDVSYKYSYDQLKMADYWISLDSVSRRAVREIAGIPGVKAQGRIVGTLNLEMDEGRSERVEARVISLPIARPEVNDVLIKSGDYFSGASRREVLVEKSFADYHKLKPGDSLILSREESKGRFTIRGIVISPEYLWVSKSAQEPLPAPRTFGIIFMPETESEELFNMKGLVNEINLVAPGIAQNRIVDEIKGILRKYGIERLTSKDDTSSIQTRRVDVFNQVRTAYMVARKDQPSNRLLQQDLDSFRQLAVLFPTLFLSMAALTIYVLLNRMVAAQRVQIGLIRALGYSRRAVLAHYLGFALFVGILGSLIGATLGHWLSDLLTRYYVSYLNLPTAVVEPHLDSILAGVLTGIIVPFLAGFFPAWAAVRLLPAEAMRPPRPPAAHRILIEKVLPFLRKLPYLIKLPVRNIFRNPRRSFFMGIGLTSATILFLVPMSFSDAITKALNTQFIQVQNYDAKIIFRDTGAETTASLVRRMEGIGAAEAVFEMPYRLHLKGKTADTSLMGLPEDTAMYRLLTPEGEPTTVSADGILLPLSLKEKLEAEIGDIIEMEPFVGTAGGGEKRVVGFVDFPMGARVFLSLEETQDLLSLPGGATGVLVRFDGKPSERLMERLYNLPDTASIELASEIKDYIDEQMGFFWVFIGVWFAMGAALGFAIIFNGVTVNVLERRREIVTMRALGMSNSRITFMLIMENLMVGIMGVILGVPAGRYIAQAFMSVGDVGDIMRIGMVISPRSYVVTFASAITILLVSQFPAIRQINRLNLSTATKDWSE